MRNFRKIGLSITLGMAGLTPAAQAQDSFGGAAQPQQQPLSQQQLQQKAPQQSLPQRQQPQLPSQSAQGSFGGQNGSQRDFSRVTQIETRDFGVAPTTQLHSGAMHGPTPTKIPGGLVITTEALFIGLQQNPQSLMVFDVLNGQDILPGAIAAAPASAPGNFNDQSQNQFSQFLHQTTRGNNNQALVFYCQSIQCWMSYNAALRAINMGYTQVLWYRGGIEAWKMAGLPVQSRY
ncbi:MAG: rhodanese-like domain-containing protein [Granulosicoccaceae bacterium]